MLEGTAAIGEMAFPSGEIRARGRLDEVLLRKLQRDAESPGHKGQATGTGHRVAGGGSTSTEGLSGRVNPKLGSDG